MVDNDTFTYHPKKPLSAPEDKGVPSLITQERTQKLELLIHLLANLTQPLIVCGPKGIGKTTLLKVLQERKVDSWLYCPVQGNADLSFEKIQELMAKTITQDKSDKYGQTLAAALGQYESQKKKIILIIDNAGQLVPGLIMTLIRYAASNPVLRVVFALTHDELHVKNRSDQAIDDCHFIEIPPLSEKQCGEFLQHLSTKPRAPISFNAINEKMVETIYRETHGIPGKIIAELPVLANHPQSAVSNGKWILPAAVVGLIAIALSVQWMSSEHYNEDNAVAVSSVDQKQIDTEMASSSATSISPAPTEIVQNEQSTQSIQKALQHQESVDEKVSAASSETESILDDSVELEAAAVIEDASEEVGGTSVNQDNENKSPSNDVRQIETGPYFDKNSTPEKPEIDTAVNPVEQIVSEESGSSGKQKNNTAVPVVSKDKPVAVPKEKLPASPVTQPTNNYTLQLMVLSKQQSVMNVLKKYPALAPGIRYSRKIIQGKERYVLMYGSFSSSAQASQARNSLPSEFRKAIPVKMSPFK